MHSTSHDSTNHDAPPPVIFQATAAVQMHLPTLSECGQMHSEGGAYVRDVVTARSPWDLPEQRLLSGGPLTSTAFYDLLLEHATPSALDGSAEDVYTTPWASVVRVVEAMRTRGYDKPLSTPPALFAEHFPGRPTRRP